MRRTLIMFGFVQSACLFVGQGEDRGKVEDYFRYRQIQFQNKNGEIPAGALFRALEQRKMLSATKGPMPEVAGITAGGWVSLGPGNIGGRVRSFVPVTANKVFVGSVGGGIWTTTNCCSAATTWRPVHDFLPNIAISTMVLDPTSGGMTMFAGTGEGFFNGDALQGAGIFKSTDGGVTWNQLASTAPGGVNDNAFLYVNGLAVASTTLPGDSDPALLAATRDNFNGQWGIWRSGDGGATWNQVFVDDWIITVAYNPKNSMHAVASTNPALGICSPCAAAAYYSTDGGNTWIAATGLPVLTNYSVARVEVAYAPGSPNIVYASVASSNNGSGIAGDVYKSTDGGHTYTGPVNVGSPTHASQGWYANMVWVDPIDPSRVIVGGLDLYQSTDGAATFTRISDWTHSYPVGSSPGPDHHAMAAVPGYTASQPMVLTANDGGIYYTSNIRSAGSPTFSSGWNSLNNNLSIAQFYGAAGNPATGVVVGGSQASGSNRYTVAQGANNWTQWFGGTGGVAACDPGDPNYFYGENTYLKIYRSTDGGSSGNYIYNTGCGDITDADTGATSLFIAPFILDPNNANSMYAGGKSLWKSTNVKAANPCWSPVKSAVAGDALISAIAVAQGNSNIVWVGYHTGRVEMTTTGGAPWTRVDLNIPSSPGAMVGRIAIDAANSNIVYLAFTGFQANNVWRTSDAGTSWIDITNNLPAVPVYSLVINPTHPGLLYAGTEIGIFATTNTGGTWNVPAGSANGDGPANVATFDLQLVGAGDAAKLLAATHGRGVWITTDPLPVQLKSLSARVISANSVQLLWTTLTEVNNYGFEVEKGETPGGPYQSIPNSFTQGHGTTLQFHQYSFTDNTATPGTRFYRLKQIDLDGTEHFSDPVEAAGVMSVKETVPSEFTLEQNFPNPFNPMTVVRYQIPVVSGQSPAPSEVEGPVVSLKVFDILGREVAVLVNERKAPGSYTVTFDASALTSGVYLYRLQAGNFTATKKLLLVR